MIDEKTKNLGLPLPHAANFLDQDLPRLRDSFEKLDAEVYGVKCKIENLEKDAALFGTKIRRRLAGDTTYYLRTDGSDSNDGLSEAAAFAALPRFFDEMTRIDGAGYHLTLDIGAGTFTRFISFKLPVGLRSLIVQGVGPETILNGGIYIEGSLIPITFNPTKSYIGPSTCPIMFDNIGLTSGTDNSIAVTGADPIVFKDISFLNAPRWGFVTAGFGARLGFYGHTRFVAGNVYACFYAHEHSFISLNTNAVLNFDDGVNFNAGYGFITAHTGAIVSMHSSVTKNGNPTGGKYRLMSGAGIVTNVGDQILPGTLPGAKDATSWLM